MRIVAWTKPNSLWRSHAEALQAAHPGISLTFTTDLQAPELANAEVLLGTQFPRELLERATRLRLLGLAVAGADRLPHAYLAERGIQVTTAHANGVYVAERVLSLTLAFFGKVLPFHKDLSETRWHGFAVGESVLESWHSIRGMRVAVLGTGAIGTEAARLFKAFDCTILGFKRTAVPAYHPFDRITSDLTEAVSGADIAICTLPLTVHTRGMLDRSAMDAMQGAFFVNVGRGPVADERELFSALSNGTLAGAAIDTWYTYPENGSDRRPPGNLPFHTLDNVILSPHVGGFTPPAVRAGLAELFGKLDNWIKTGRAPDAVDPAYQY